MARVEKVRLVDDIDGSAAAETIEFSVRGRGYEIDLSDSNAKDFDAALAGFIESARRRGKAVIGTFTQVKPARSRSDTATIRIWARENGFPNVQNRGRVPAEAVQAYEDRAQ